MKSIFIYFSLESNTDYVAQKMKQFADCDLLRIEVVKPYPKKGFMMYWHSGKDVMTHAEPDIKPYKFDASKYDLIIFGTPVWARDFAAPLKKFIRQNNDGLKGKRFAVYTGYRGAGFEQTAAKLAEFIGIKGFEKQLQLVDPGKKQSEEKNKKIFEFCKSLGIC